MRVIDIPIGRTARLTGIPAPIGIKSITHRGSNDWIVECFYGDPDQVSDDGVIKNFSLNYELIEEEHTMKMELAGSVLIPESVEAKDIPVGRIAIHSTGALLAHLGPEAWIYNGHSNLVVSFTNRLAGPDGKYTLLLKGTKVTLTF